jgi:hypothetical protein
MTWIFYALAVIVANIVAYITNPIVCFFADEYGNLPHCLRWWQTEDNCLDVEWMISEGCVWKIFRYNFNKHYIYHYEDKNNERVIPGYVEIIDPNFTFKEKVQRYFCRLAWLYRNTAYGFSYEICGRDVLPTNIVLKKHVVTIDERDEVTLSYDKTTSFFNRVWKIYICKPWFFNIFYIRIYLGWKMTDDNTLTNVEHDSIAFFFNPFRLMK